jgi:hypothetical protein
VQAAEATAIVGEYYPRDECSVRRLLLVRSMQLAGFTGRYKVDAAQAHGLDEIAVEVLISVGRRSFSRQ